MQRSDPVEMNLPAALRFTFHILDDGSNLRGAGDAVNE
jgi:hypothetical protein